VNKVAHYKMGLKMKNIKKLAFAAIALAVISGPVLATDYSEGLHKNDYKWMQANLMYSIDELPNDPSTGEKHNYLELEFGGRSGIVDLYGYVDVFNLGSSDDDSSDKGSGASKIFMKLAPRFSLDAITGRDMSFGPVQEVYIATLFNWGGGEIGGDVNNSFWGLGTDVMVPWFGKVGMNLYGLYDINKKEWNGAQFSTNWFKPFYHFDNESFIAYQGYIDYQFGADADSTAFVPTTSSGGVMFNGIYWHSDRYSVGYGLKGYQDVYTVKDKAGALGLESTGFSHYFAVTYKL
jgi:nucleoside-specific channel-forming protein